MTEPCLICCPINAVPEPIRELIEDLRNDYPPDTLRRITADGAPLIPPGREVCWNCAGRGEVPTPPPD